ncbi:glycoside hydrolase [Pelagibacterium sp. 26DY04]|uniref:F510_1955 family glycosylhydrolase n=1 Tax=Pelagibacterium sp. 26DY04 TaxID=2967130 RepID=UPI002815AD6A|nr:sialidase family protein [Pelagibacterium sp. 26DY04]WMT86531.1 glycoside hydrolase [Pelagibacterium sp. 26DY04]
MSFFKFVLVTLVAALLGLPHLALSQEARPLGEVLEQTHIHGLAPELNSSRILMATHHGLWAVDLDQETAHLLGDSRNDFMGFSSHPADAGRFWASGHPITGGNLGVIMSMDGGVNWTKVAEGVGGPVDFHQMTISQADPNVLYGVHQGASLQKSDDGGRSWDEVGLLPDGIIDLAASAIAPNTLFAATNTGLFKSEDAGRTWMRIYESSAPVSSIHVDETGVVAFILGVGIVTASENDLAFSVVADDFGNTYLLHLTSIEAGFVAVTDQNALVVLSPEGQPVKTIS